MKKLEDLKKELLSDKLEKMYVFYGEDFGIRKHYINKISTYFRNKPKYINDYTSIKLSGKTKTLFGDNKSLVIIYDDEEFAKQPSNEIQKFIDNLRDYTCIFEYETALENSNLFKDFDKYITYFPVVQNNIAREFVESELKLDNDNADLLAHNCDNNYNSILLESDKVREYAQANSLTDQNAYEALRLKDQMTEKIDTFSVSDFMNDVLLNKTQNFPYWYEVIKNDTDKFFGSLIPIFNDFLIAALVKKYGKWEGSSAAYNCKLSWNRAKVIREFIIPYSYKYLYECAYKVACIDTDVKTGRIEKDKIIDYFFSGII